MKKGQISLDIIFTIILIIIITISLLTFGGIVKNNQDEMNFENELKKVAIETTAIINTSQIMGDGNLKLEMTIPSAQYKGLNRQIRILVDETVLTTYSEEIDSNFSMEFSAGEYLVEFENDKLVVSND